MPEPAWRARAQLIALARTAADVDSAIRRGDLVRLSRDLYVPKAAASDVWQRAGGALSTQCSLAALSRRSAAVSHGFRWLPTAWHDLSPVCVDAPRDDTSRSARSGIDRNLSALPPEDVIIWQGLRITSAARTAVDLARFEQRQLAVSILDGVLTDEFCTKEDMFAVLDRMYRVPFSRRARALVDLARKGVDSPRETDTRLQIVGAGLPTPDVNLQIKEEGRCLAQGDLGYWQWLIWIDYDGREEHKERRANGSDQAKDRWLGRRGWDVFRVTNRDYHSPQLFLQQLAGAIRDAPARIAAMRPERSPEVAAARVLLGLG